MATAVNNTYNTTYNKKFICATCKESTRIVWRITKVPDDSTARLHVIIYCRACEKAPVEKALMRSSYETTLLFPDAPRTYTQDPDEAAYWEGRPSAWEANGCPALPPTIGWPSP